MNEIKDGSGSALEFYDGLADSYHLIGANWDEMVRTQGQILDKLIRGILPSRPIKILDCSCGIGTQAIGLALQGHEVRTQLSADSSGALVRSASAFRESCSRVTPNSAIVG
jgi:glycine/sarcosine N-methyltransferase